MDPIFFRSPVRTTHVDMVDDVVVTSVTLYRYHVSSLFDPLMMSWGPSDTRESTSFVSRIGKGQGQIAGNMNGSDGGRRGTRC